MKKKNLKLCEQLLPEIELKASQLIQFLEEYGFKIKKPYIEALENPYNHVVLIKFNINLVYQNRNLVSIEFVAIPTDDNKFSYSAYVIEGTGDTPTMRNFLTEMNYIGKKEYYSLDDLINKFKNRNKETFVSFKNLING